MIDDRAHFARLCGEPREIFSHLHTPCYIIDEAAIIANCRTIADVGKRSGAKMLLAQKAFAIRALYPTIAPYVDGTEASGLFEARFGAEEMPHREVHVFCAAFRDDEIDELTKYADHIVFNSPRQLEKFGERAKDAGASVGLRVNPELSTQDGHAIYDPCAPGSRLGTTRERADAEMTPRLWDLLDGLHFHTLCEQNSDALDATLDAFAKRFGDVAPRMKWINMGGGHHITKRDYDIARLERCVARARDAWNVDVYLEPGEAWALDAGYLATRVLDVAQNGATKNVIIDASAACHMPDVIEMPYRPPLYGDIDGSGEKFRVGGPTCLAGDVVGDYEMATAPREGDVLLFGDMAIYTMVKNNTFNGMPLPPIYLLKTSGEISEIASFGYEDFSARLGRRAEEIQKL